jgi:hypothetical protein
MEEIAPRLCIHRNDVGAMSVPALSSRLNGGSELFPATNWTAKDCSKELTLSVSPNSALFLGLSYAVSLTHLIWRGFCLLSSESNSKYGCALNPEGMNSNSPAFQCEGSIHGMVEHGALRRNQRVHGPYALRAIEGDSP